LHERVGFGSVFARKARGEEKVKIKNDYPEDDNDDKENVDDDQVDVDDNQEDVRDDKKAIDDDQEDVSGDISRNVVSRVFEKHKVKVLGKIPPAMF